MNDVRKYKVGDIVKAGNTKGIIFCVNEDNTKAFVMSRRNMAINSNWYNAIKLCEEFDDSNWYLPTIDELYKIYKNSLIKEGIYWSSTEYDTGCSSRVWVQGFSDGRQGHGCKHFDYFNVIAVREIDLNNDIKKVSEFYKVGDKLPDDNGIVFYVDDEKILVMSNEDLINDYSHSDKSSHGIARHLCHGYQNPEILHFNPFKWHLPSIDELSLIEKSNLIGDGKYWSSTEECSYHKGSAYVMDFYFNFMIYGNHLESKHKVRAVREIKL